MLMKEYRVLADVDSVAVRQFIPLFSWTSDPLFPSYYCMLSDNQKIGAFLSAFGVLFTLLGVILFFDRGLLAIGNLSFLVGVTLVIGLRKTQRWLLQRDKLKGTICFLGGTVLVLSGWAFIGLVIEIFGFINLFGNFFPYALAVLRRLPIIGHLLNLPLIAPLVDRIVGNALLV